MRPEESGGGRLRADGDDWESATDDDAEDDDEEDAESSMDGSKIKIRLRLERVYVQNFRTLLRRNLFKK